MTDTHRARHRRARAGRRDARARRRSTARIDGVLAPRGGGVIAGAGATDSMTFASSRARVGAFLCACSCLALTARVALFDAAWSSTRAVRERACAVRLVRGEARGGGAGDGRDGAREILLEIVLAGHAYEVDFDAHYLWDLALPGVNVVLYRRERADVPLRRWTNGCGTRAEERLLLPNHGRDAAAFYDYVLWRYDAPPRAVAFMHGHGALSWHTSCEVVFTRLSLYHDHLQRSTSPVDSQRASDSFLDENMITLTFARGRKETQFAPLQWNGGKRRRLLRKSAIGAEQHPETTSCTSVLGKVGVVIHRAPVTSCCGTFILPGKLIKNHGKHVYEALFAHVVDTRIDDQISGRECFEFIVYGLFTSSSSNDTRPLHDGADVRKLEGWFEDARRSRRSVLPKMKRCERHYGVPYLGDSRRTLFNGRLWFPARRYVQGAKG